MLINDLAVTGSFTVNGIPVQFTTTGSFATTGSNSFIGSQTITGSLIVTNQIVAQTLNVQQISSSIVYSSGSNIFGNSLSNTQQLTGSVSITGSLTYNGANITTIGNVTTAAATGAGQVAFFNGSNVITSVSGLYFDGVNKLGIGTISPSALLHLNSSGTTNLYIQSGTGNEAVIRYFSGTTEVATARANSSGSYFIETGVGSPTEKLRITSGGNVGIGTSTPSYLLDVAGTSRSDLHIFRSNQSAPTADAFIFRPADNSIALGTANSERVRVDSSGNVGIGTTSPSYKLDVTGTGRFTSDLIVTGGSNIIAGNGSALENLVIINGQTYSGLRFQRNSVTKWAIFNNNAGTDFIDFYNYTTNTSQLVLTSSGNLGLGVVPSAWSGFKAIQVNNASLSGWSSDNTAMYLGANNYFDGTNFKYISSNSANQYRQQAGDHYWFTAPSGTAGNTISFTQAMTLDASGRLMLGTTSLTTNTILDVATAETRGYIITRTLSTDGGAEAGIRIKNNVRDWYLFSDNTSGALRFYEGIAGTERLRITSGGDLLVGTTSTSWTNTKGIYLFYQSALNVTRDGAEAMSLNRLSSDGEILRFFRSGTQVGNVSVTTTATTYNTSSDYRLKEDFKNINGLDIVGKINVYNFKWKSSNDRMDGVLAHELQEILPYAVQGQKDGDEMQVVDYSKIVPVLIQSIKELKAEIEQFKNK